MTTIEIDTDGDWDDVELQIRELETDELIALYELFESNPTVFQLVDGELTHRKETGQKLASVEQKETIESLVR